MPKERLSFVINKQEGSEPTVRRTIEVINPFEFDRTGTAPTN